MSKTIALFSNNLFYVIGIKNFVSNHQLQNITLKDLEKNSLAELLNNIEIATVTCDFLPTVETINFIESLLKTQVKVIYFASEPTSEIIPQLWAIGCQGIVAQSQLESQLTVAITAIDSGGSYYSQGILDNYMTMLGSLVQLFADLDLVLDKLTPKELEIFELYVVGESLVSIMKQLNIAKTTLNTHMESIRTKFGIRANREIIAKYQICQLRSKFC
ncbi:MAG: helix-turn-helix transcriptional regulator [Waterburya sp.]